ncbi:lysoplasmalogenase [Nocardioides pantholopis]|uniref:lysoplasmalogenase n=1 Tax=Nocardioides pantholopis TaxID=2483798 RepID=UPI000F086AF8|nr:lysoplasmalogenase [Nocardioides pantholopis]
MSEQSRDEGVIGWVRRVGKPLLVPALAVRILRAPHGPGRSRVLAALGLSWGGDLALNRHGNGAFLAGLGSFLAAHLAYISAFRRLSSAPVLATPGRRRALLAGGTGSALMALAAGRGDRALAAPVAAYGVTLSALAASAAAVDRGPGRGHLLAGTALFLTSDVLIGVRKFFAGDRGTALEAAVLTTYAAAQWSIGEGLVRRWRG